MGLHARPIKGRKSIQECLDAVEDLHGYLVRHGSEALGKVQELEGADAWGSRLQRAEVDLPPAGHLLLPEEGTRVNLFEAIHCCVYLEKLIDLFRWLSESELREYKVILCHLDGGREKGPPGETLDNDTILIGPAGEMARFEAAGQVLPRDTGGKEKEMLLRFGVLKEGEGYDCFNVTWPEGRMFLVVSGEFAKRLKDCRVPVDTRPWITRKYCHYSETKITEQSRLLEIRSGGVPCGGVRD